jgi:hypothetical protein
VTLASSHEAGVVTDPREIVFESAGGGGRRRRRRGGNLDFDWAHRKALPALIGIIARMGGEATERLHPSGLHFLDRAYRFIYRLHGPTGVFARTWSTGAIAFWAVLGLLGFCCSTSGGGSRPAHPRRNRRSRR